MDETLDSLRDDSVCMDSDCTTIHSLYSRLITYIESVHIRSAGPFSFEYYVYVLAPFLLLPCKALHTILF